MVELPYNRSQTNLGVIAKGFYLLLYLIANKTLIFYPWKCISGWLTDCSLIALCTCAAVIPMLDLQWLAIEQVLGNVKDLFVES